MFVKWEKKSKYMIHSLIYLKGYITGYKCDVGSKPISLTAFVGPHSPGAQSGRGTFT